MHYSNCPLCDRKIPVNRGFCFCGTCAAVFNENWCSDDYGDLYFTDQYRKQYGKTYEQDFEAIYRQSVNRIDFIEKCVRRHEIPKDLLDIGCAYGFFLKAAYDRGYICHGIEISMHAVEYAKTNFPFDVRNISLENLGTERFPIVTFWYVAEHFYNIKKTFDILLCSVSPGGIAAFSMPSWFGPAYIFHRKQWEKEHPKDHRIDFSPRGVRRLLRRYGYRNIKIRPASYHPERLVGKANLFFPLFAIFYRFFAKLFIFGDTLEVCAYLPVYKNK